jgi:putative zinc finger protein
VGGVISCRNFQPLLGMYAIGRLTGHETTALLAHLDGCPLCRIEVAELRGVAEALSHADPDRVEPRPEPPPWLRDTVFEQIGTAHRRSRHRVAVRAAVCGIVGVAVLVGALLAWPKPSGAHRPSVAYTSGGVHATATLVARPWGTQLKLSVSGLTPGRQYTVWLERTDGQRMPAGSFTALGGRSLRMELSSGMQISNATAFGVTPTTGGPPILRAPIPAKGPPA